MRGIQLRIDFWGVGWGSAASKPLCAVISTRAIAEIPFQPNPVAVSGIGVNQKRVIMLVLKSRPTVADSLYGEALSPWVR